MEGSRGEVRKNFSEQGGIMGRGKQWNELELGGSDAHYEAMLNDFQFFENWETEQEAQAAEWGGWSYSLKDRIQQLKDELESMWKSKIELTYDMGWRLIALRSVLKWKFKDTVEECLPFSFSTACNYINVASRFDSAADAALFDSKVMYAMATKTFPYKVRKDMILRAKKGEVITLEEARNARDQAKREAACGADEESTPIDFEKTPYMEMADKVKATLEGIISEVEAFAVPADLSTNEKWRRDAVWVLLDKLVNIFDPDDE